MPDEMTNTHRKILSFLYWEETLGIEYHTVKKIQEETELSGNNIQESLKALGCSGYVYYVYRNRHVGIEEARITAKGMEKARQLLNDE